MEQESNTKKSNSKLPLIIIGLVIVFGIIYFGENTTPKHSKIVSGVPVSSAYPFEELTEFKEIAMYNTTERLSEYTCKFELTAISEPSRMGYVIKFEEGPKKVEFKEDEAVISGNNPNDLLLACHAFACIREGIDCPDDLNSMKWILEDAQSISIVLEEGLGPKAGRGFAEVIGVLSYIQSIKIDTNGNGQLDQEEVDKNEFFIYPFIKNESGCYLQKLNNFVQKLNESETPTDCEKIAPAIFYEKSEKKEIVVGDSQIFLRGDESVHFSESVILRDILAPEWIRHVYGMR